jgi:DNA-binding CsgD family transcriptional regulator
MGPPTLAAPPRALTPRQLQVLRLIADGLTSRQIATELGISERTVEVHRDAIYRRLGVHSALDAIRLALRRGWVSPASGRWSSRPGGNGRGGPREDTEGEALLIPAFAVRLNGRLLLHTLRPSEDQAQKAAVRGIEQSRARWPELQRRGYVVVRVRIQAESIRWAHPPGRRRRR